MGWPAHGLKGWSGPGGADPGDPPSRFSGPDPSGRHRRAPTAFRPGRLAPYPSMSANPPHDARGLDFDQLLDDLTPADAIDVLVADALAEAEDAAEGEDCPLPVPGVVLTMDRLGRILHGLGEALSAGSLAPAEVAATLRDLGGDLMDGVPVGGMRL